MLPSGNDAAFALAQYFGRLVLNLKEALKHKQDKNQFAESDISTSLSEN